ncbi:MAG: HupE/UreJ family protein [Candidatus Kapaibacterium sp.]
MEQQFETFFKIGFFHILEGYDHLLFLLGLIIVTKNFRSLFSSRNQLYQV